MVMRFNFQIYNRCMQRSGKTILLFYEIANTYYAPLMNTNTLYSFIYFYFVRFTLYIADSDMSYFESSIYDNSMQNFRKFE